jgi:hypothetical protein
MTDDVMRQAVVAHLVQRPELDEGTKQAGRPGWSCSVRFGGGPGADPATIKLIKTRSFPTCQLHSVTFINHRDWTMHDLIKTWQEPDGGWQVRQANAALYRAVIVRMRWHAPTMAYVERRTAQGLSKKDIIRCLKRYLIREVYQLLPPTAASDGSIGALEAA